MGTLHGKKDKEETDWIRAGRPITANLISVGVPSQQNLRYPTYPNSRLAPG